MNHFSEFVKGSKILISKSSHDRRIIIVATEQYYDESNAKTDWSSILQQPPDKIIPTRIAMGVIIISFIIVDLLLFYVPLWLFYIPISIFILTFMIHDSKNRFPIFDLSTASKAFDFPMNHPIEGYAYACCDALPNTYVPIANFHNYMYQSKLSAFNELLANLGAKKVSTIYESRTHDNANREADFSTPMGSAKATASKHKDTSHKQSINMEFPKPSFILHETRNNWLIGEPSWKSMQKLRLEKHLNKFKIKFTYKEEMGINAKIAGKIAKKGISIGGSFQKIKEIDESCEVEFWDMQD